MPGNETEQRIDVRAFTGVDIETDPAFLANDVLQASQNLVPELTYLLTKRAGTELVENLTLSMSSDPLPWLTPRVDVIRWALQTDGTNLLFFVVTTTGDGIVTARFDRLYVAVGSPPMLHEILLGGLQPFTVSGGRYGMTILGGKLYVGNGVDPLVAVDLDTLTATAIDALGSFTMANTAALVVSTTSVGMQPGTYSFRWAYLDSGGMHVGLWQSLGPTGTIVVTGAAPQAVTFTGPSNAEIAAATNPALNALDATHTAHLFLSPPNLPIEYARDHGYTQASATTLTINQWVDSGDLVPLNGAAFTGRYLQRHRGRVWIAGDQTNSLQNTSRLYSTNVIVPGFEQTLYNWGDFFPALANTPVGGFDGDVITGIVTSQGGANKDVATAPMVIFKNAAIYAWFGDLVDDDQNALIQVSDLIGCVAPQSIVATSEGVIFMGSESVYYLGNGFTEPIDIGIPIRPAIESIPANRLQFACATFHRGFYKLAITSSGSQLNTVQWWLDLRPSASSQQIIEHAHWWGPHQCMPVSTMEVGTLDPEERERLYVGREIPANEFPPTITICKADQEGIFTDISGITTTPGAAIWDVSRWDTGTWGADIIGTTPVIARLRTGGLIQDEPFEWKDWTCVRCVTRPDTDTPISITVFADGGFATQLPTMNQNQELDGGLTPSVVLAQAGGAIWDVSLWDVGIWGQRVFVEGWSEIAPVIRSHSLEVEFLHNNPSGLLMRDVEVTYRPVARRAPGAV